MAKKTKTTTTYEIQIVRKESVVCEPGNKVTHPSDIVDSGLLDTIKNAPQEHFVAISLDGAGQVITSRVVTIGILNSSLAHPRETFRGAILDNAASIILAHNHPSGDLNPSANDIALTQQMAHAGEIIGIKVIDHIIVSKKGYNSLKEHGIF